MKVIIDLSMLRSSRRAPCSAVLRDVAVHRGEAVVGSGRLPADAGRVYRDTHRVVLKAKAPFSGEVRAVRLRLHERPAGPGDGSGWDVCAYTAADGAMGESKRSEARRDKISRGESETKASWRKERRKG